jgi:hypothetical protein
MAEFSKRFFESAPMSAMVCGSLSAPWLFIFSAAVSPGSARQRRWRISVSFVGRENLVAAPVGWNGVGFAQLRGNFG